MKALSLFSGAGGFDIGFGACGIETVCAIELEPWACETLRLNLPELVVLGPPSCSGDIKEHSSETIGVHVDLHEIDFVYGGPPCQPFSAAASQRFLKDDDRYKRMGFANENLGSLVWEFVRIVGEIRPKFLMIENVPGFKSGENNAEYLEAIGQLQQMGYNCSDAVVNAMDYGVPQTRERLIIVGVHSSFAEPFKFPQPTNGKTPTLLQPNMPPFRTSIQALVNVPLLCENHVTRVHSEQSLIRYRRLAYGKRDKLGRVDRLKPNAPSKTVIAGGKNGGGRSHLHPLESRTLSPRECARLQTFPDSYKFTGTTGRQFTQIGNAVPPLLAQRLGEALLAQYSITPKQPGVVHHTPHVPDSRPPAELMEFMLPSVPEIWRYEAY